MSNELDIDAVEESARKRRFHEHTSVLVISIENAYMAAGRALTRINMDDSVTRETLTDMMSKLSTMGTRAKHMRDFEG